MQRTTHPQSFGCIQNLEAHNMKPLISIIVPVYKVEPYLKRCVQSILAQTYPHWELILVDDGSPDRCPQMCDEFAAQDHRISVIHKANGGLSDARNHGLDASKGDYIFFVDSDDYIHSKTIEAMTGLSIGNNADIVQCSYIRGEEDCFPEIKESSKVSCFDKHAIFSSPKQRPILCAKLYKSHLWRNLRMPVGITHEDEATTWKLYYRSNRVIATDTPYYYYYKNPQGIMGSEDRRYNPILEDIYNARIAYFKKHDEEQLATLSCWQFCLPLMYLYLRGNLTLEEERHILHLLRTNVKQFVHCSKVPFTHRLAFRAICICPTPFRGISLLLGKAHTIRA